MIAAECEKGAGFARFDWLAAETLDATDFARLQQHGRLADWGKKSEGGQDGEGGVEEETVFCFITG